jgi:hypothetical protein
VDAEPGRRNNGSKNHGVECPDKSHGIRLFVRAPAISNMETRINQIGLLYLLALHLVDHMATRLSPSFSVFDFEFDHEFLPFEITEPFEFCRKRRATNDCSRRILHMESFLILYFLYHFTFTVYIFFSLVHLHQKSLLILYFCSHPSTSYARWVAGSHGRM